MFARGGTARGRGGSIPAAASRATIPRRLSRTPAGPLRSPAVHLHGEALGACRGSALSLGSLRVGGRREHQDDRQDDRESTAAGHVSTVGSICGSRSRRSAPAEVSARKLQASCTPLLTSAHARDPEHLRATARPPRRGARSHAGARRGARGGEGDVRQPRRGAPARGAAGGQPHRLGRGRRGPPGGGRRQRPRARHPRGGRGRLPDAARAPGPSWPRSRPTGSGRCPTRSRSRRRRRSPWPA